MSFLSGSVPSRHLLGTVAVYYRGSLQYSIVQKLFFGKSFPPSPAFQSCLWKRFPPVSFFSGSVPSRHLLGAVAVYYRGSLQYSIVQKLFLGKSFPNPPAFQSCLWKRFPPVSYRGSLQYSIVQKIFFGKSFPPSPAFQSCLWKRFPPREFYLGFGTIKASSWRCSGLLPEVSPYSIVQKLFVGKSLPHSPAFQSCSWKRSPPVSFLSGLVSSRHLFGAVAVYYRGSLQYSIVQKTVLGEIFSPFANLPELSLEALPPREFSLGFGTIKASFWRRTKLLPEVSSVFDRTETVVGEIFSTSARLPELSLEALPPREISLGFGTIKASFWRSTKPPPEVSRVFFSKAIVGTVSTSRAILHALSRELVITKLSLRPIVDCRFFCHSFDACWLVA